VFGGFRDVQFFSRTQKRLDLLKVNHFLLQTIYLNNEEIGRCLSLEKAAFAGLTDSNISMAINTVDVKRQAQVMQVIRSSRKV
jgi:hypothetical protein